MNTDGTGAKPLVESSEEDSLFYKKQTISFILSHDAARVAFITKHYEKEGGKSVRIHTLWSMKTDLFFKNGKAYALAIVNDYRYVKRYNFEIQEKRNNKWVAKKQK